MSFSVLQSAELPSKGIERPRIYSGLSDGGFPAGPPGAVGEGVFILLGLAATYSFLKKKSKSR